MNASSPIAVVGLGGLFPGAPDLDTFQRNILSAVDAAKAVPPGRWILDPQDAFDPDLSPDTVYSKRGCFVEGFAFDPSGLNLNAETLRGLDPSFEMVLHVGRQAWNDAVTGPVDRQRVGVMLAAIALPTDGSSAITREVIGSSFERSLLGDGSANAVPVSSP